jgi:hypothetical protein
MARSKKNLKKVATSGWQIRKISKSLRTRNTLIRPFGISVPQLSSEYTVGEVKFRALIEDGKDIKVTGRSQIHWSNQMYTWAMSRKLFQRRQEAVGNCYINLRRPFSRVTPEPGLQFHANLKVGLCHIISLMWNKEGFVKQTDDVA